MCGILSGARGASCIDAAVHMFNSRTSKILCHRRLLNHLLLSAAYHSFSFSTQHAPGINNHLADALSCFHCQELYRLVPDAQPLPTTTHSQLRMDLTSLLYSKNASPSWLSHSLYP